MENWTLSGWQVAIATVALTVAFSLGSLVTFLFRRRAVSLPPDPLQGIPDPSATLKHAILLKNRYVEHSLRWYRENRNWPMIQYRSTAIAVIAGSAVVPVLVQSQWFGKDTNNWVAAISLLVSILSGISTFYGFDRIYRGRRQAESAMENRLATWELEIVRAVGMPKREDGDDHILKATRELLQFAHEVSAAEVQEFFQTMKQPDPTP